MYSTLVTKNSYCVVFDTIISDLPNNKRDLGINLITLKLQSKIFKKN